MGAQHDGESHWKARYARAPAIARNDLPASDSKFVRLTLSKIVEVALAIQNSEGLDAVTTRRLAQILEVTSPAMYRHVRSKEELLGHMIAVILTSAMDAMRPCSCWQDWLEEYARTYRAALLRHRDSAKMMLVAAPSERTQFELVPAVYKPLMAWGVSETNAAMAEAVLASLVLGWVGYEQNPALRPILAGIFDLDEQFARSVRLVIAGLETELGGAPHRDE